MKLSFLLEDDSGHVFEGDVDLKLKRSTAKPPSTKHNVPRSAHSASAEHPRTPTDALHRLHQKSIFKIEREFQAVEEELGKIDCNFPKPSLAKALERAKFLTRHGERGSYRWIQKYPPGS
ncbi:MAG: hypothetical protein DMG48_02775 [Acidobacteria bacterium]|nr:MAG: hypothetical protein DMG48_02775 [Acidobacteriota bacterium]